ncbi:GGDEF domain-containing protein [Marinomonas transparens]|uniref:GGDEF domain-containing protein n=1 Tax=Marinomonas transparens TaxID=2795388 RepID=A0A934JQC1_9GAMM|nr:GGDEF domain-containing protein [Marinomonas transparens]MBJ7536301.1 GGDEF domain-containing protein [Marinomonas transparens]
MTDWLYRWHYAVSGGMKNILRHKRWLFVLSCVFTSLLILNFSQGELKPQSRWVWVDIIGEGASAACVVIWLLIVLSMRPPGYVTNWFAAGFIGIFASNFQDFLDEWVRLPKITTWNSWVESLPIGLLALTVALWLWRKEQRQIDRYLLKRQAIYQDSSPLDETTSLPKAAHLSAQLEQAFAKGAASWKQHALLLLDVAPFSDISYRHGGKEADRFLVVISELIMLTLRKQDVLCHLAGDRFALVFKNVDKAKAQHLAQELETLIKQFRYRVEGLEDSIVVGASMVMIMADEEDDAPEHLLDRASFALSQQNNSVFSNTFG